MSFISDLIQGRLNVKKEANQTASQISSKKPSNNTIQEICKTDDEKIKEYDVLIADLSTKNIKSGYYTDLIKDLVNKRSNVRGSYKLNKCDDVLESLKVRESADILGTQFSQYDVDVLEKSRKEQNLLLYVGGGVILIGLLFIVKK